MGLRRGHIGAGASALAALLGLAVVLAGGPARAEFQGSVYGGWNGSLDSDVHLTQPNDTNMTLSDVPWDGLSFSNSGGPPYYGFRGIYWLDSKPGWGIAIDYNHAKARAKSGASVSVSGTRDGGDVSGTETVGETFSLLEFTDGLNMLLVNAMYRWQGPRWTPYVGLGVGLSIPHVEVRRADETTRTFEYQVAGVAAEGLAGLEWRLSDRWGLFGEYKLSYAEVDADLDGGGSLETDMWTNHVIFGVSFHFQPSPPPMVYK